MIAAAVADFAQECKELGALLDSIPAARWKESTAFKAWTPYDVVGHLHMFDHAARLSVQSEAEMRALFADIQRSRAGGKSLTEVTREWLGGCSAEELLTHWRLTGDEVRELFSQLDPRERLPWGGPNMSARSLISARQMETWAHGQAIFDLLGQQRRETDRIRNIVIIGVNTFGWSFTNRGLDVPQQTVRIELEYPSGRRETWHEEQTANTLTGRAVEFCQVVTQTRNVADTDLVVEGPVARKWMTIAQCFAGPAEIPPAPGARI